jgi:hypothetical protein
MPRVEGGSLRSLTWGFVVAVFAAVGLLAYAGLAGAGTENGPAKRISAAAAGGDLGRELPKLRTRTSRTFELSSGQHVAQISPMPVNFRDESGTWRQIDNELVSDPAARFALRNEANDYTARLPQNISDPIRFELDDVWAEMRLEDANATASSKADTVVYTDALPGASVSLTATNTGLKEDIILSGADSSAEFRYRLRASEGLTARRDRSGGAALVDRQGRAQIRLAAPFMTDSAGVESRAVTLNVVNDVKGQSLVVRADREWLAAPERQFPVVIDPTWVSGADPDCGIAGGPSATTNFCMLGTDKVGYGGGQAYRALMKFDIQYVVPRDSQITRAALAVRIASMTSGATVDVSAHRVTNQWTDDVTWNTRNGTNAWTTAGGDFDPQAADSDGFGRYGAPDFYAFEDLQQLRVTVDARPTISS